MNASLKPIIYRLNMPDRALLPTLISILLKLFKLLMLIEMDVLQPMRYIAL